MSDFQQFQKNLYSVNKELKKLYSPIYTIREFLKHTLCHASYYRSEYNYAERTINDYYEKSFKTKKIRDNLLHYIHSQVKRFFKNRDIEYGNVCIMEKIDYMFSFSYDLTEAVLHHNTTKDHKIYYHKTEDGTHYILCDLIDRLTPTKKKEILNHFSYIPNIKIKTYKFNYNDFQ